MVKPTPAEDPKSDAPKIVDKNDPKSVVETKSPEDKSKPMQLDVPKKVDTPKQVETPKPVEKSKDSVPTVSPKSIDTKENSKVLENIEESKSDDKKNQDKKETVDTKKIDSKTKQEPEKPAAKLEVPRKDSLVGDKGRRQSIKVRISFKILTPFRLSLLS